MELKELIEKNNNFAQNSGMAFKTVSLTYNHHDNMTNTVKAGTNPILGSLNWSTFQPVISIMCWLLIAWCCR